MGGRREPRGHSAEEPEGLPTAIPSCPPCLGRGARSPRASGCSPPPHQEQRTRNNSLARSPGPCPATPSRGSQEAPQELPPRMTGEGFGKDLAGPSRPRCRRGQRDRRIKPIGWGAAFSNYTLYSVTTAVGEAASEVPGVARVRGHRGRSVQVRCCWQGSRSGVQHLGGSVEPWDVQKLLRRPKPPLPAGMEGSRLWTSVWEVAASIYTRMKSGKCTLRFPRFLGREGLGTLGFVQSCSGGNCLP